MHPYASVCIQYASVCIRMHPYASIRLIYASERQYSRQVFSEKIKKSKNNRNLVFYNAIRSAQSVRIQPNIPNIPNLIGIW